VMPLLLFGAASKVPDSTASIAGPDGPAQESM